MCVRACVRACVCVCVVVVVVEEVFVLRACVYSGDEGGTDWWKLPISSGFVCSGVGSVI